jgi:hypothetical protein
VLELDGHPIRSDGLHFDEGPGGRLVSKWIVDHALALGGTDPVFPHDAD